VNKQKGNTKQYKSYPVFINYNLFTEKEREESERKWLKKYEAEIRANPKLRQAIERERAEAIEQYGGYNEYRLAIKQYL